MSEILGWVCFDLEPWKRELSAAQCQIGGKDEEGNLSQITSLQKSLWMCCQPGEPSCRDTGHRSWLHWRAWACAKGTPEKDEERSPAHRGAPVAFVFLYFPSQLNYLPPGFVWPHSHAGAQMLWPKALSQTHLSSQALGTPYFF